MKAKKRILCFLLCFMFLFCIGCADGGLGGEDDDNAEVLSMQGAKVLSKPSDYSFANAVGNHASENYYNIFSSAIMRVLYQVYENDSVDKNIRDEIYKGLVDTQNGETFKPEKNEEEYYLWDSLRYTIKRIDSKYDKNGDLCSVKVTLDAKTKWKWTIETINVAEKHNIIFKRTAAAHEEKDWFNESDPEKVYYEFKGEVNEGDIVLNWEEIYNIGSNNIIDFKEFYTGEQKSKDANVTDYWTSPYYNLTKDGALNGAVNYFQDALEYATYLIVLGYDFEVEEDAALFNFIVEKDETTGLVTGMRVYGWEDGEAISVSKDEGDSKSALSRVKDLYKEQGAYIGINEGNKEKLAKFIKNYVIGQSAYAADKFEVRFFDSEPQKDAGGNVIDGMFTEPKENTTKNLKFNRNYDIIVKNIIDYACSEAPIGFDGEKTVTLDDAYLASKISDYSGNFFGASYENNEDDNMFQYIEAAEYQSLVIFPNEKDFDANAALNRFQTIGDLWLLFEYYDENNDQALAAKFPNLKINVGFRYFDHTAVDEDGTLGKYTATAEAPIEIAYGRFPTYYDTNGNRNPNFEEEFDSRMVMFSDTDTVTDYCFGKDVAIKTKFNRDIGNGAINPFAEVNLLAGLSHYKKFNGVETNRAAEMTISGESEARKYYTLEKSSDYGYHGVLDGKRMFVGEDGCDFIEIYFDIVKPKGVTGINYNFKVAIYNFLAAEDAMTGV